MVQFIPKYVEYSRILGIYTLAIRIRQYSWWTQELLRNINPNVKKLKDTVHKIKKKENFYKDLTEIKNNSGLLASELGKWMHYLKLIYFHNSTILYLNLKILLNLYSKVKESKKKVVNLRKHEKEKQNKIVLQHKIKQIQKEIKDISEVDDELIDSLNSFKKGFNKSLRKGFSIKIFTLLKEQRISQKMKIKARKIKELEPKRRAAMANLNTEKEKDIKKVTNLIEKEIHAVEKDVLYTRQLIKKLKTKKSHIESLIKQLGKKMYRMKFERDVINSTLLLLNKPYGELDKKIEEDTKKMFYNALRQLNMSSRKSRPLKMAA